MSPIFNPVVAPRASGFTAVILAYDRIPSLFQVIERVALVPSLAKVLVIWNNQVKVPPSGKAKCFTIVVVVVVISNSNLCLCFLQWMLGPKFQNPSKLFKPTGIKCPIVFIRTMKLKLKLYFPWTMIL
jgi:hypothetical protein